MTSRLGRIAAAIALCAALAASPSHAGPAGFAFLEIPTGARASALGGAYVTMADGADAAFWNPAGFASARRWDVSGGHSELFQKLRHDYFGVAGPLFGGGIGASMRALYSEPIDERDEFGNLIGSFGANDLEFLLGYGWHMAGISAGVSAQALHERIANSATTTYAFGFGADWTPAGLPDLTIGASAQNLGPAAHYTIEGEQGRDVPTPAAVQAGASYGTGVGSGLRLRGALEGRMTRGRNGMGLAGVELAHETGAALRFGVRANDSASTVSFGAGYVVGGLQLDYAFVPLRLDLGDTHRFSFRTSF
jgi:hypothetical protein